MSRGEWNIPPQVFRIRSENPFAALRNTDDRKYQNGSYKANIKQKSRRCRGRILALPGLGRLCADARPIRIGTRRSGSDPEKEEDPGIFEQCRLWYCEAFRGLPTWWRRGVSNPRPKTFQKELLRAQTVIAARRPIPLPAGKPSRPAGQVAS